MGGLTANVEKGGWSLVEKNAKKKSRVVFLVKEYWAPIIASVANVIVRSLYKRNFSHIICIISYDMYFIMLNIECLTAL